MPAIAAGVVLLLIAGFIAMYQVAYTNRIYPGVRALGYDLGGYSREEAGTVLQHSLDEFARRQLTVRYAEVGWTLSAQELGLRSDLAPILDSVYAVGREGNIFGRFSTQFGMWRQGRVFEHPSAAFDQDVQTALLQRLALQIDRPVVDARLTIKPDFTVELQEAQSSRAVDIDSSRRRLQEALAVQSITQVDLAVSEMAPRNATNNLQQARDQAARIMASPLNLRFRDRTWVLGQPQLASVMRFNNDPSAAKAAYLDRPALETWARSLADMVNQSPEDARFAWAGGKLDVIRPSRDGLELDPRATVDAIIAEAEGEHHDITLPVAVTKPAVPMEDREQLGIKELIESAKTSYAGSSQPKRDNIALAADRLNGAVVPPGATFSFNKEIGSTSLDVGFKMGWGISGAGGNVKTIPSVAGGICQVATTLFHTVFWSGLPLEQRNWHLYWIPSYTSRGVVGIDATVDEDSDLDFKFVNPTDTAILVQSWVDGSTINFALYGTRPAWSVRVEPSVITDVVPAERGTINYEDEPTIPEGNRLQVEGANDGFVVTNVRHVTNPGGEDRVLRLVSRYKPSRNVILIGTGGKPPRPRSAETIPGNAPATPGPTTTVTGATVTGTPNGSTGPSQTATGPTSAPLRTAPQAVVTPPSTPATAPIPTRAPTPASTPGRPALPPVVPAPTSKPH